MGTHGSSGDDRVRMYRGWILDVHISSSEICTTRIFGRQRTRRMMLFNAGREGVVLDDDDAKDDNGGNCGLGVGDEEDDSGEEESGDVSDVGPEAGADAEAEEQDSYPEP